MCWSIRILLRRSQHQYRHLGKLTTSVPGSIRTCTNHMNRLKDLQGDWHEFESKALRRENERKDKEARRAVRHEEHQREKEKRRASVSASVERDAKRIRPSSSQGGVEVK